MHRGGKKLEPSYRQKYILEKRPVTYVPPSIISAGTIPPNVVSSFEDIIQVRTEQELSIVGMPETVYLDECAKVLYLMKEIVKEATEIVSYIDVYSTRPRICAR